MPFYKRSACNGNTLLSASGHESPDERMGMRIFTVKKFEDLKL